ncbi:hypothetical protein KBD59_05625 [Candidatus Gracilibacteria bacterium]|nr:hypothetical protein [Candidatus Gracilibacteria bacterium]
MPLNESAEKFVLVVDDEALVRSTLKRTVIGSVAREPDTPDFRVVEADNAASAIALLTQESAGKLIALFCDHNMDHTGNGQNVMNHAMSAEIGVPASSIAYITDADREHPDHRIAYADKHGIFLTDKPFRISETKAWLLERLRAAQSTATEAAGSDTEIKE